MNNLYVRLAAQNIKKHRRSYVPFMLAGVFVAAVSYILNSLSNNTELGPTSQMMFTLGSTVVMLFAVIFLFYTNSFLMKQRKKELGLYNVLGMNKGHIARVIGLETLFTALIVIVGGCAVGILLDKLTFLIVAKMIRITPNYGFHIIPKSLQYVAVVFGVIYVLIYISNVFRVRISRPIELLHGTNVGEREPKTKWLLTLLGIGTLGTGYYIAVTTKNAIAALGVYFVAVILVIIGTYCLFSAVSIAVLKALRRNKRFYYKTGNFIGISGMLHRMNRNAVGLANICILSTMVLVMISSTLSLYMGTEDSIRLRYPADISGVFIYNEDDNFDTARLTDGMTKAVRAQGLEPTKIWSYNSMPLFMVENNNELRNMNTGDANGMVVNAVMLTAADYTAISGKELTLAPDEVMYVGGDARYDTLHISIVDGNGSVERREFRTVEQDKSFKIGQYVVYAANIKYLIFPDMAALRDIWKLVEDTAAGNGPVMQMTCNICFDTDDTDEQKRKCGEAISDWDNVGPYISGDQIDWERYYVNEKTENAEGFYSMNGAFLFLGGFLGIIFMMAMVLIIYYKQISEGYEDRERYRIMQQVGLQKEEVRSSINKQVLIVFFAPLVVAAVHVAFDFSLVKLMLQLFGLMNVQLAMWCTVGSFAGFALIYALVYMRTAKVYYKIVSE